LQFAPSLAEAALSLQAATVAAQTAEVLRESVYTPAAQRDLGSVLDVAAEVNPHLAEQPRFRRFLGLVNQLHELRSRHGPQE
jgi:hypothetical protein